MNAADTNVWIYVHDVRDRRKQRIAEDVVARVRPLVLPWQVGCEFMAASRKLEPLGFTRDDAWQALDRMQRLVNRIILPAVPNWRTARDLMTQYGISFWDALLSATCLDHGVSTLYTEDFGSLGAIDGMRIINPFV